MNAFLGYSYSLLSISLLAPEITEAVIPVWIWRAFVSILIVIVGYFLKKLLDDAKEDRDKRDKRIELIEQKIEKWLTMTAAHDVMYELWVENLAGELRPENGTRKADLVAGLIKQLAEAKKND